MIFFKTLKQFFLTIYKDGSFDISKLYKQTQLDGILEQYMKKQNSKGKL